MQKEIQFDAKRGDYHVFLEFIGEECSRSLGIHFSPCSFLPYSRIRLIQDFEIYVNGANRK